VWWCLLGACVCTAFGSTFKRTNFHGDLFSRTAKEKIRFRGDINFRKWEVFWNFFFIFVHFLAYFGWNFAAFWIKYNFVGIYFRERPKDSWNRENLYPWKFVLLSIVHAHEGLTKCGLRIFYLQTTFRNFSFHKNFQITTYAIMVVWK